MVLKDKYTINLEILLYVTHILFNTNLFVGVPLFCFLDISRVEVSILCPVSLLESMLHDLLAFALQLVTL